MKDNNNDLISTQVEFWFIHEEKILLSKQVVRIMVSPLNHIIILN
jgi:hypothetical protein